MSKIYLYCLAAGTGSGAVRGSTPGGDVVGFARAEDGTVLGSHYSSSVSFSKHDMGLTSDWHHDLYKAHYPHGFDLEWIDEADLGGHAGFRAAIARAEGGLG